MLPTLVGFTSIDRTRTIMPCGKDFLTHEEKAVQSR
jgi:hypothetical protein